MSTASVKSVPVRGNGSAGGGPPPQLGKPHVAEAWVASPTATRADDRLEVTALNLSRHGVAFEVPRHCPRGRSTSSRSGSGPAAFVGDPHHRLPQGRRGVRGGGRSSAIARWPSKVQQALKPRMYIRGFIVDRRDHIHPGQGGGRRAFEEARPSSAPRPSLPRRSAPTRSPRNPCSRRPPAPDRADRVGVANCIAVGVPVVRLNVRGGRVAVRSGGGRRRGRPGASCCCRTTGRGRGRSRAGGSGGPGASANRGGFRPRRGCCAGRRGRSGRGSGPR